MYLNSINSYRAIAIFMIVSAHCYSISEVTIDSFPEALFANMTAGSTFYFIFISGFLFHHIFVLKNKIPNFFTGKLKKLLIPYTILSIVPIILKLWFEPNFWSSHINFIESSLLVSTTFQIILYYFTGAHLVAYWYIPFAVCLFALYPLHVKFINLTLKKQLLIFIPLYLIALLAHRPVDEINVLQSLIYFTPMYLFGILCSLYKESIYTHLENKEIYLIIIVLSIAAFQAIIGRYDNYQKNLFIYDGIDLILLQKTFLCLFLLSFLNRFESYSNKMIKLIASASFGIYFLHSYFLQFLFQLKRVFNFEIDHPWVTYFFVWAFLMGASTLLALIIKKVFPKYSKYITGY